MVREGLKQTKKHQNQAWESVVVHGWAVCCPFQLWGCFRKEIKKEKDQKRVWEDEDAGRLEHSMLKRSVEQDLDSIRHERYDFACGCVSCYR